MKPNEREALSKKVREFLKGEMPDKPFLLMLSVLDHEATGKEDQNHTEIFIEPSEPFTRMPFNRAKILIETTGRGIQMFLNQTAINIQNTTPKEPKKEPEPQYG